MATKQVVNEEVKTVIGIPVRHYSNTFRSPAVHHMTEDFGESNTDKSFFRPDLDKARSTLGQMRGSTRVGLYDYPDGKDKGDNIQSVLRSKGLDPTEIASMEKMLRDHLSALKKQDKDAFEQKIREMSQKDLMEYVKKIADASKVEQSSSTSTDKS